MMKAIIHWIKQSWAKLFKKTATPIDSPTITPKKKRREPVKSLWPSLIEHVEQWEEAARDDTVHWSMSSQKTGRPAREFVRELYAAVPLWGAYAASDYAEVRESDIGARKIDQRAYRPQSLCFAWYGPNGPQRKFGHDDNILTTGITLMTAVKSTELHKNTYPMHGGALYDVQMTHWERGDGHSAIFQQVIIDDDGVVHPTWFWHTAVADVKHRQHDKKHHARPKNRTWMPVGGRDMWVPILTASSFNFCSERDAHWNCVVKSDSVPPICFPVMSHDIARVFPSRQRDGDGRIVHWTRAHKRATKNGDVIVRTHIRGNTAWNIDGRHVQIMMPGKHHSLAGTIEAVSDDSVADFIKDPITGMVYGAIGDSLMRKLLSRAVVSVEKIEVAA